MLKAVRHAVECDRQSCLERRPLLEHGPQFETGCQEHKRAVRFCPPAVLQRIGNAFENLVDIRMDPLLALVKRPLADLPAKFVLEVAAVGNMDLQPTQTLDTDRLAL